MTAFPEKDDYRTQRARIEKIAKELVPNGLVEFDPDKPQDWMKFRIVDRASGIVLLVSSGDWHATEIADKSDDWIIDWIKNLSAGRIKAHNRAAPKPR